MTIYFLPSYVQRAPSSRMRVYKIAATLNEWGESAEVLDHNLPVEQKHARLQNIKPDDIIYIQKWRTEFNSEKHLSRYKGKCKIVFDLDDNTGDKQALELIQLADALVVGNHWLYDKFDKGAKPIFIVPSPVDISEYPKFDRESGTSICLAKCGIRPMLSPLRKLKGTLDDIRDKVPFDLILGGFQKPQERETAEELFSYSVCYDLETYDNYLKKTVPIMQTSKIGILPFQRRDQGKSGHSALANLAMGVPTIASPYAECDHIIVDGENGFLAKTEKEWYQKILILLENEELRQQFRVNGWKTIINDYDVPIIAKKLLESLRSL